MDRISIGDAFTQILGAIQFQGQVRTQHFFDIFANVQLAEILQIRKAFQKQDTLDIAIGMLHFIDRLVVFLFIEAC
ncbi:hypothetical protein D3C78_1701010 [compost metagenome]